MKKIFTVLCLLITYLAGSSQSTTVVISQVYGGGGSGTAGPTYNVDYVELHNISSVTQDISGFKLMYGSSTGNLGSNSSNIFTFPAGVTIPAGGYLLIASTVPSAGGGALSVTADFNFTLSMSGTSGKVAFGTSAMLANTTYAAQPAGSVIDFVGYGSANESETAPTAALTTTTGAVRNANGCTDTNNNSSDFTVTSAPLPRNSTSAVSLCAAIVPVRLSSFVIQKAGAVTKISWTTEQELNSKDFSVERSTDGGRTWTIVVTIPASGSSNSTRNYSIVDNSPAKGMNLYRLRSTDTDNTFANSDTKAVLFGNKDAVLITPNPASSFLNIFFSKTDNSLTRIFVTDANGRVVEKISTPEQSYRINTSGYVKGMYVVKVLGNENTITQKVVVQ